MTVNKQQGKIQRIWEIDFLRGILILLMVVFHLLVDLNDFYDVPIPYDSGILNVLRIIVASIFVIISGMSTSFSRSSFRRGVIVLAASLGLTLVTYIFNPKMFIWFGILHLLGVCMMLSPILKNLDSKLLAFLAVVVIMAGVIFTRFTLAHNYLFMFGITSNRFASLDYYPLFPWGGIFILGMILSRYLYKEKISLFPHQPRGQFISFIGRQTLIVYLAHQPVILGILALINMVIPIKK